jgi:NitT/TauT family transport system substrate-binding protein
MKGRFWAGTVLILLVSMVLSACDGGTANPTPTAGVSGGTPSPGSLTPAPGSVTPTGDSTVPGTMTKVRTGYVPVMIFAPLFVAAERGYFAEEGIEIELTPVQGGSDSVVQLAAGNFDAAVGGAGAGLFNAAQRGVKFTIVAPMHSESPPITSPLVISAKRAEEIKSVADLRGKKVSINATGAATEYWLAQAMEKNGLTINDIEVVTVTFSQVPAALESRSIDAAILGEPLATINEDNGNVKVLAEDFINGFYSTYLYMGEPLLKGKPEAARGFMRAYLRACRDLQGSYMNEEIASIIEKYTNVPAAVTLRANPAQYDPNGAVPIENLETLQRYFLSRGVLEYNEPLDVKPLVDTNLAAEVARELENR